MRVKSERWQLSTMRRRWISPLKDSSSMVKHWQVRAVLRTYAAVHAGSAELAPDGVVEVRVQRLGVGQAGPPLGARAGPQRC